MEKSPKINDIKLIGKRIKEIRMKQGISQNQLAFEIEKPRSQVGRIERGEINTSITTVLSICKALNIHPKDFFDLNFEN